MKLDVLMERISLSGANDDIDEMDDAYDELALLNLAFKKNDLGILINKQGDNLDMNDVREIKRKLAGIIRSNPIIDGSDVKRGRDGYEKLRLIGRGVGHGLELTATAALTGALGALTVTSVGVPIVSILSGTAAVGAAALAKHQFGILGSLKATSRLIDALDAYEDLNPKARKRSFLKRLVDKLTFKSKDEIKKDTLKQIKNASKKAQRKFEKSMKGFPRYIEYHEGGEVKKIAVATLFKDL